MDLAKLKALTGPGFETPFLAVNIFFPILSTVVIALRLYTRGRIVKQFVWDDGFLVAAQMSYLTFCSLCLYTLRYDMGKHIFHTTAAHIVLAIKYSTISQHFFIVATTFYKISITFLLYHLSPFRRYRYSIVSVCVLTTLLNFSTLIVLLNLCRPYSYTWTRIVPGHKGTCLITHRIYAVVYTFCALDIFSTFFFSFIPIPMLWNLRISRQSKLCIYLVLGVGALASIATCFRLHYFGFLTKTKDPLYDSSRLYTWTTIEVGLGITGAGLATLRPLLHKIKPSLISSFQYFAFASRQAFQVVSRPATVSNTPRTDGFARTKSHDEPSMEMTFDKSSERFVQPGRGTRDGSIEPRQGASIDMQRQPPAAHAYHDALVKS